MLRNTLLIGLLIFTSHLAQAQPQNDLCVDAQRLCAGQPLQGTTTGATATASEEDNFCSVYTSTIWYLFTTNSMGGNVTVDFTNMSFNPGVSFGQSIDVTILEAPTPCNGAYTPRVACQSSGVDFSFSTTVPLDPNTTYYIMINGTSAGAGVTQPAECDFTIEISGPPVDTNFPTVSISATNTVLCQGDDETVDVVITDCADTATYNWYYEGALISSSSDTNEFNTTQLSSSGNLYLEIQCGDLCVYADTTDSIYFDVTPISANAGPDKFIQEGEIVALEGSGSGSPIWSPGTSLTDPGILQPSANPSNTTTYFLTMTNGSCIATDSVNVFVGQVVVIYSAFSPNDDDINDKWVITNSAQYPDMEVTVYDRSGQRVFNTTGYSTQDKWWDGTHKGKALPVSTYFYVVDLKIGDDGIFKGQVNIIR